MAEKSATGAFLARSVHNVGLVSTSQTCSRPCTGRALTRDLGRVTPSRPASTGACWGVHNYVFSLIGRLMKDLFLQCVVTLLERSLLLGFSFARSMQWLRGRGALHDTARSLLSPLSSPPPPYPPPYVPTAAAEGCSPTRPRPSRPPAAAVHVGSRGGAAHSSSEEHDGAHGLRRGGLGRARGATFWVGRQGGGGGIECGADRRPGGGLQRHDRGRGHGGRDCGGVGLAPATLPVDSNRSLHGGQPRGGAGEHQLRKLALRPHRGGGGGQRSHLGADYHSPPLEQRKVVGSWGRHGGWLTAAVLCTAGLPSLGFSPAWRAAAAEGGGGGGLSVRAVATTAPIDGSRHFFCGAASSAVLNFSAPPRLPSFSVFFPVSAMHPDLGSPLHFCCVDPAPPRNPRPAVPERSTVDPAANGPRAVGGRGGVGLTVCKTSGGSVLSQRLSNSAPVAPFVAWRGRGGGGVRLAYEKRSWGGVTAPAAAMGARRWLGGWQGGGGGRVQPLRGGPGVRGAAWT